MHCSPPDRRGAVSVEFALCAPLLFLFFFAAVEFSRVNMLRQSAENAAYEGARRGIVPGATAGDVRDTANGLLDNVWANNATVTVSPTLITRNTPDVTVTVAIPVNDNLYLAPRFFQDYTLTSSLTLARERYDTTSVP